MTEQTPQPTYHQWLGALKDDPIGGGGARGCGLIFSALGVTFLAALLGFDLFPAGRYPRILLMLPGLLAGGLYIYLVGFFFFKLHRVIALVLGIAIGLVAGGAGAVLLYWFYTSM
ncbi:MAG: hypothetical protein GY856_43540 [bacterium]|nr:hypothetical protein [bacterium]